LTGRASERGRNAWKRISWDEALTRVTEHTTADRDANLVKTVEKGGKKLAISL
jgi:formate dehydrogenase major subunit